MPRRKDIRSASDGEKYEIYRQITELNLKGIPVMVREHKSGFPAITIDCEEIHILTDCLSLEEWNRKEKKGNAG